MDNSVPVGVIGMDQARTQFENAAWTFANQLGRIDKEVDLLRSTWTGSASVKFGSAMADWEDNFAIVIKELQAMVEAMGGSAAAPGTREGDGVGIVGSWSDSNGGLADI